MNTTPASLLERLRQPGEAEAWDRFVDLYTPLLFSWGRHVGLQDQDAADLVYEVFMTLVQKLPDFSYDRTKSFRGWLRTVTINKWVEKWRRKPALPQSTGNPAAVADSAETDVFWETEYRRQLVRQVLAVMQREFQETTWKACWECVVGGRSGAEVAAQLNISVGEVRAAKCRVLSRLRQELDGLLD